MPKAIDSYSQFQLKAFSNNTHKTIALFAGAQTRGLGTRLTYTGKMYFEGYILSCAVFPFSEQPMYVASVTGVVPVFKCFDLVDQRCLLVVELGVGHHRLLVPRLYFVEFLLRNGTEWGM